MSDGKKHALLSPSASHRWINCPPSARLTEFYTDTGSGYAQEGTLAHSVGEAKLKHRLGLAKKPSKCNDSEMDEGTDDYVTFVMEQMDGLSDPKVFVEQRVDCSLYIPECSGTCDALIISDGVLQICDLKYGRGVRVAAEGNEQLMIYALSALSMFDGIYDIHTIRMSIFQPRLSNCSTWEVSRDELERWAEETLKPAAQLAWDGNGNYKAGDHCQFCKAKAECRERAKANMELAAYDFIEPSLLENDEIAAILGKVDELTAWASDIKDYALSEALKGVRFDGWKVVEGRSNRKYTDEAAVANAVTEIGLDPYEHKILGISQAALERFIPYLVMLGVLGFIVNGFRLYWAKWNIPLCVINAIYNVVWAGVVISALNWPDLISTEFLEYMSTIAGEADILRYIGIGALITSVVIIVIAIIEIATGIRNTWKSTRKPI